MKFLLFLVGTIILVSRNEASQVAENYWWRDYNGKIPLDAIIAGTDATGKNVYIGQAPDNLMGVIVVQITPGSNTVYAPSQGVRKLDKLIKILCGSKNNFYWKPANATNIDSVLAGKTAVTGGHEFGWGYANIGRIQYEGGTKIGKVNTFQHGNAYMYYVHNEKEKQSANYEVLIVKPPVGPIEDYWWKDFNGAIPSDAIKGGVDAKGNDVYIGQAPDRLSGVVIVQITPGQPTVNAPFQGVMVLDKLIKILCGNNKKLNWVEANSTNLDNVLVEKTAVIGGHKFYYGDTNIGRINLNGETKIGNINTFHRGTAYMSYVHNGREEYAGDYEVLVLKS